MNNNASSIHYSGKNTKIRTLVSFRNFLIMCLFLVYLANCYLLWGNLTEDAYISLRYARSLAQGHGLVYNPGEYVEGYTNFLWVLIEAFILYLGMDPVSTIRILGCAIGIGTWLLLLSWSSQWFGKNSYYTVLPIAYLSVSGNFINYSISGLETNFYGFLLFLGLYFHTQKTFSTGTWIATLCVLGASLTRPEGVFFALGMFMIQGFLVVWKKLKGKHFIRNLCLYLIPYGSYLIWKLHYYGSVIPNTFYVRTGDKTGDFLYTWWQGMHYFKVFLVNHYWVPGLILLAFLYEVVSYLTNKPASRRYRGLMTCFLFVLGFYLVVMLEGGDYMLFNRMFVPVLPVVYVLLGPATGVFLSMMKLENKRVGIALVVILHMSILVGISGYWWPIATPPSSDTASFQSRFGKWYRANRMYDEYNGGEIAFGTWLKQKSPPGITMATKFAGVVPYYSELVTYDCLGLTDTYIARSSLRQNMQKRQTNNHGRVKPAFGGTSHAKRNWEYIFKRNPDFMVLFQPPVTLLKQAGYQRFTFPGKDREYWAKSPIRWRVDASQIKKMRQNK